MPFHVWRSLRRIVFCDGSVRTMAYELSATIHERLGARNDGLPTDE
jgi:hypothetical protein